MVSCLQPVTRYVVCTYDNSLLIIKRVITKSFTISPFFIQPVFREEGHFMIVSQFQAPNYFLCAFLEDYKMDPSAAQPLLTISVFDDLADTKDVVLLRCDIINRGIEDDEGYKICQNLIKDYIDFESVQMFNKKPDHFNIDDFVKEKEQKWDNIS